MGKMVCKRPFRWINFENWGNRLFGTGKLRIVLISILLLVFGANVFPQTQEKRFSIASFSLNGGKVDDFDVYFLKDGKYLKPDRAGEQVIVPVEIQEAPSATLGIRFVIPGHDFSFLNLRFRGYDETDEVKSDYKVEVSTDPRRIRQQLEKMSEKSRNGLGIVNFKDICAVYALTRMPTLRDDSKLIADPVTLTNVKRCEETKK